LRRVIAVERDIQVGIRGLASEGQGKKGGCVRCNVVVVVAVAVAVAVVRREKEI